MSDFDDQFAEDYPLTDALADGRTPKEVRDHGRPRPGVPARAIRVEDELWEAAKRRADERGETVSGAIRTFLRRYVR